MTFGVNPLPDCLIRCRKASHACISVVGIFDSLKTATSFASVPENVTSHEKGDVRQMVEVNFMTKV